MTTITKNKITDSFLEIARNTAHGSLAELNEKAVKELEKEGLPAPKAEEYKFTPISKKLETSISNLRAAQKVALTSEQVEAELIPGLDADLLVFNNGHFEADLSSYSEENYSVKLFSELTKEQSQLIGTIAPVEKEPFNALNSALFTEGLYIEVAKNKAVEKPILLLNFCQANNGQVITPRLFVQGEANAEATFIERVISLDDEVYFLNGVTEVKVNENAHLYYHKIQNESEAAIEVHNFEADIHRDATCSTVTLSLKGDIIRNNLSLNLKDSGCEGNMYGLYLLNGTTHVDNHTNVDHTQPHADSNELYKGVLADKSKGIFNGKIFVRQDAQKTNAFQQNNNILLSEDAIIHTKPQLEIWADDVKCSHGCTTGQLDEEAQFYLQARGIGKAEAKNLLLYAFAGEILDHIKIEAFREYCIQLVQERLGNL
ncbi:Fe-S cluster assembly protein SufD [Echinicola strongylocentroti]|uniref:Fe-S cluster assembly protein SufD n=1 Tax=Echinicola strongylocentroti TaxID=1795355 RepID=A0A2Z4IPA8_9BACT|nr:Fe-S cluster assembly protein SufD [Echinicola strongylocentroti]AWW32624.1 Fe-S cluster assembly protein SufD [Echinicola strongylocentroti]